METCRRYFIPVCLYPHTRYRTRSGLCELFRKYQLNRNSYLIVIADRLLGLDRLVTGRFWTEAGAFLRARREATQVYHLIRKTAIRAGNEETGQICYWDDISNMKDFQIVYSDIESFSENHPKFGRTVSDFVSERICRFGLSKSSREYAWEFDYIVSEIAMSVYCTEILSYTTEVWEKRVEDSGLDPIETLYEDFSDDLRGILNVDKLRRSASFLS